MKEKKVFGNKCKVIIIWKKKVYRNEEKIFRDYEKIIGVIKTKFFKSEDTIFTFDLQLLTNTMFPVSRKNCEITQNQNHLRQIDIKIRFPPKAPDSRNQRTSTSPLPVPFLAFPFWIGSFFQPRPQSTSTVRARLSKGVGSVLKRSSIENGEKKNSERNHFKRGPEHLQSQAFLNSRDYTNLTTSGLSLSDQTNVASAPNTLFTSNYEVTSRETVKQPSSDYRSIRLLWAYRVYRQLHEMALLSPLLINNCSTTCN